MLLKKSFNAQYIWHLIIKKEANLKGDILINWFRIFCLFNKKFEIKANFV